MTAQTCPRCGLLNPATAEVCDCGYDFRTGATGPRRYGARRSFWSIRVDSAEDAKQAIRETALGLYAIAAIQAMSGFVIGGRSYFATALVFGGLAFWLQKSGSRAAAVLLLIVSLGVVGTIVWGWTTGAPGGRNVVLAFFVAWAALKAYTATSKLTS